MHCFEFREEFPGFAASPRLRLIQPLPDVFAGVCTCCNIQHSLIGFRVLHNRRSLTLDRKADRPLAVLKLLHEIYRPPSACYQG